MAGDYSWEKFHLAVLGLAGSEQPLRKRLADAYVFHLLHAENNGLPPEIAEDFGRLSAALRRRRAVGDEGDVAASAAALDELEVHDLIDLVVSMYDRVAKYGPNG